MSIRVCVINPFAYVFIYIYPMKSISISNIIRHIFTSKQRKPFNHTILSYLVN